MRCTWASLLAAPDSTFTQTGGTFTSTGTNTTFNTTMYLGQQTASSMTVSGGTFTSGGNSGITIGVQANSSLTVSGTGTVAVPFVWFGYNLSNTFTSTVNLDGGTIWNR